jgi:hypothetical protein
MFEGDDLVGESFMQRVLRKKILSQTKVEDSQGKINGRKRW